MSLVFYNNNILSTVQFVIDTRTRQKHRRNSEYYKKLKIKPFTRAVDCIYCRNSLKRGCLPIICFSISDPRSTYQMFDQHNHLCVVIALITLLGCWSSEHYLCFTLAYF